MTGIASRPVSLLPSTPSKKSRKVNVEILQSMPYSINLCSSVQLLKYVHIIKPFDL